MNDVGIVIGVLAMIVALGAVFFSNIAVKRMEDNNQEMLRSYVDPMKAQLAEMKSDVNSVKKKTDSLERADQAAETAHAEIEEKLASLDVRIGQLTGMIATLNQNHQPKKKG